MWTVRLEVEHNTFDLIGEYPTKEEAEKVRNGILAESEYDNYYGEPECIVEFEED